MNAEEWASQLDLNERIPRYDSVELGTISDFVKALHEHGYSVVKLRPTYRPMGGPTVGVGHFIAEELT